METPREKFLEVIESIVQLQREKDKDYKQLWTLVGLEDINNDIKRKYLRLWMNRNKTDKMSNETLLDTYIDLAVYSIFGAVKLKNGWTSDKFDELIK